MSIQRTFVNVLAVDVAETAAFYRKLFDWRPDFESDWFVSLRAPDKPEVELGVLARDHEIVPESFRRPPAGALVTIVVDDVDKLHARAAKLGVDIVEPPRDLFYGQRRMLITDPDGTLVDVSSECPPSPEFLASLGS